MPVTPNTPPSNAVSLELIIQCITSLRKGMDFKEHQLFQQYDSDHMNQKIINQIDEIILNLAWSTSYLTGFEYENVNYNGNDYVIKRLGEEGVIESFIDLMDYENSNIRHPFIDLIEY